MLSYRISLLAADGRADAILTLSAMTDDEAAALAGELLKKSASVTAEVWESTRLVFRVARTAPNFATMTAAPIRSAHRASSQ
jgi:hypothetical protein